MDDSKLQKKNTKLEYDGKNVMKLFLSFYRGVGINFLFLIVDHSQKKFESPCFNLLFLCLVLEGLGSCSLGD